MDSEQTIKVTAFPGGRRFPSVEAAIRYTLKHPQSALATADALKLQRHSFVNASWTFFEWYLLFTDGLGMRIWIDDCQVLWELQQMDRLPIPTGFQTVGATPIVLDWWKTVGPFTMDRSLLVDNRRGALFEDLFCSEHGLFLYLKGHLTLHFAQAVRESDGVHIIYAQED